MSDQHLTEHGGVVSGFVPYAGNLQAYLARPSDGSPHPGVLVIQEWWGIDAHIKELTERLAREGYVALAPDLYHGQVAAQPEEAMQLAQRLDRDQAVQELLQALHYLRNRDDVGPKRLGAVGFCMGGRFAWQLAERADGELAAVAPFYGGYNPSPDEIQAITAPVLAVWGERDQSIPAEERERVVSLLEQQGKTHRALLYPAEHAFMNDQRERYHREAAAAAWNELLGWFRRYVGGTP